CARNGSATPSRIRIVAARARDRYEETTLLLFLEPAGLADGLALKEMRYADDRRFAPRSLSAPAGPPLPETRMFQGFGLVYVLERGNSSETCRRKSRSPQPAVTAGGGPRQ